MPKGRHYSRLHCPYCKTTFPVGAEFENHIFMSRIIEGGVGRHGAFDAEKKRYVRGGLLSEDGPSGSGSGGSGASGSGASGSGSKKG